MSSVYQHRSPMDLWNKLEVQPPTVKEYLQQMDSVIEGPVFLYKKGKSEPRKRHLFLSGKLLIICKRKGKDRFDPKAFIGLCSTKDVTTVPDSRYETPNVEFRLYGKSTFIFFAPTQEDRDRWVHEMKKLTSKPLMEPGVPALNLPLSK